MHLFISNFKDNFIIRSIIAFVSILVVYNVCLYFFPHTLYGATISQTNLLKAQNFVFSNKKWDIVVIGSSIAYGIPIEKVSANAYNLAFAGGASNTGLDILSKIKNEKPKVVFIEANETLMRGVDYDIVNKTSGYVRYIPFLQAINRPDAVLMQTIQLLKYSMERDEVVAKDRDEPIEFYLNLQQKSADTMVDQKVLESMITEIEREVLALKKQGVTVVFIEPPMHASLYNAKKTEQVRRALFEKFPQDQYHWLFVDWRAYKTNDGIHLGPESANKYAETLRGYLTKIENL